MCPRGHVHLCALIFAHPTHYLLPICPKPFCSLLEKPPLLVHNELPWSCSAWWHPQVWITRPHSVKLFPVLHSHAQNIFFLYCFVLEAYFNKQLKIYVKQLKLNHEMNESIKARK